jgi:hypothetical protein
MKLRTLLPAALCLSAALGALAQHPLAPAPSTWKLNASASNFGGTPPPTSITTWLYADTVSSLHWKQTVVDSHGTTTHSWKGAYDGKLRPITDGTEKFSIEKDGTFHVDEADGSTVDGTIIADDDLKSYTETSTTKTRDGHEYHTKLVYDRVK